MRKQGHKGVKKLAQYLPACQWWNQDGTPSLNPEFTVDMGRQNEFALLGNISASKTRRLALVPD